MSFYNVIFTHGTRVSFNFFSLAPAFSLKLHILATCCRIIVPLNWSIIGYTNEKNDDEKNAKIQLIFQFKVRVPNQ